MSFQLNKAYNRESFVEFLSDKFLPEDFRPKRNVEEIELSGNQNFATRAFRLGECRSLELEVFEIHHSSLNDARVGIAKDAFQLLLHHSFCNRALVAFVPEGSRRWRFSLIQIEAELNEHHRITRGYSNPRRYSFLLGEDTAIKTPTQFLIGKGRICQHSENGKTLSPWEDLVNRFSVEALTKEFYEKLYNWYLWAVDNKSGVTFPNKTETDTDDRENINRKMIRLITRMLFVWFIKQKHLVPSNIFEEDYLCGILREFNPKAKDSGIYYNAILQNLFFATLNQEIPDRSFAQNGYHGRSTSFTIKNLYRDSQKQSWFTFSETGKEERVMAIFKDIPYLNGGLFDCLDKYQLNETGEQLIPLTYYDGFSSRDAKSPNGNWKYRAFVPNNLFFEEEHKEVITADGGKQEISVEGLLNIFKRYNFTVEENTPNDTEVSLDPELLGRVFENLLAAYNPETQESARKSTGSFYTPRFVVDYMVDEALITHLTQRCGYDEQFIRHLIKDNDTTIVVNKEKLAKDIMAIKILDPACGSGAFPMGFLLKMTEIIERLHLDNFDKYQTKLEIIKGCIYGVDIQPIAMLICKLRFFISLICDSEYHKEDVAHNFGIIPLPNLETKFVAANSLLSADVKHYDDNWQDEHLATLKQELLALRTNAINIQKHKKKLANLQADSQKCNEIEQYIIQHTSQPNEDLIARLERDIVRLREELVAYQEPCWVDEMVAQTSLFDTGEPTMFRRDINKVKREDILAKIKNCQNSIKKEREKTVPKGFEAAVKQVTTDWNPYDQNKVATFFDPEWMFGVSDGFDIVIGNPPYISTKGVTVVDKKAYEKEFGFSDDTYNLFTFKGLLLTKEGGSLTYIIPKTFWTTQTKRNMRDLLLSKKIRYVFDAANPFESVMVDTCIIQVVNTTYDTDHQINFLDGSQNLDMPIVFEPVKQSMYLNTQNNVIFKPTELNLRIWKLYGEKVKALYDQWWEKIKTSRDIEKNKAELEAYRASLKPGDIALLGALTEGGVGLQTGNNGKYVAIRKSSKWSENVYSTRPKKLSEAIRKEPKIVNYIGNVSPQEFLEYSSEEHIADTFDKIKEDFGRDIFGQGYIYRLIEDNEIADVDSLSEDEKQNGIDTSRPYYVPYDKGDKDGNRWYLETPYAIAWSKENVRFMKTYSGKKGEGMPVVRNPQFYFKEGFCWNNVLMPTKEESMFIKARIKGISVNDVASMSMYSLFTQTPNYYFVSLLGSKWLYDYLKTFINNTVNLQINDFRLFPIIIPNKEQLNDVYSLFHAAYENKANNGSAKELSVIEREIDSMIEQLYTI